MSIQATLCRFQFLHYPVQDRSVRGLLIANKLIPVFIHGLHICNSTLYMPLHEGSQASTCFVHQRQQYCHLYICLHCCR
jgi:hypothetical protein